jgi:hypothetical protein
METISNRTSGVQSLYNAWLTGNEILNDPSGNGLKLAAMIGGEFDLQKILAESKMRFVANLKLERIKLHEFNLNSSQSEKAVFFDHNNVVEIDIDIE